MAVSFGLRLPVLPSRAVLVELAGAPLGGLESVAEPWIGGPAYLYLPGLSTRGLTLGPEEGMFLVRVNANAAPEELLLAVRLAAGLARRAGVTVHPEAAGELTPDAFALAYGPDWAALTLARDVAQLRTVAEARPVAISGPHRSAFIGSATLARAPTPEALLAVLRAVQYPDGDDDVCVAEVMRVADEDSGRAVDAVVFGPGVAYFFPPAQVVAVLGGPAEDTGPQEHPLVHVPFARLADIAPDHVVPVDEVSVRVRAVEVGEWSAVHRRAWAIGSASPFELVPPEAESPARPAGTLLPVLRPPHWAPRDVARCRPLFTGRAPAGELPLVSWGIDTPLTLAIVPDDGFGDAETADPETMEAAALRNLEALPLPFRPGPEGAGKVGLVATGEYAAELVLSEHRMREAAEKLGVGLLAVAMPVRGLIQIKLGDDVDGVRALVAWAEHVYTDATSRPDAPPALTPLVFGVHAGKIVALVQLGDPKPLAAAPADGVRATLPARAPALPLGWIAFALGLAGVIGAWLLLR